MKVSAYHSESYAPDDIIWKLVSTDGARSQHADGSVENPCCSTI
jgi:hypothetical protein